MITLRFSTNEHDLTGFLIRSFTWSPYSHVDIVFPGEGLLGAHPGGVQMLPDDYEPTAKVLYLRTMMTQEQEHMARDFWRRQIGKPYDYKAVAGNIFHRDWKSDDKWFCSELAAAGFSLVGFPLLNEKFLDRVTPGMLLLSPRLQVCSAPQTPATPKH